MRDTFGNIIQVSIFGESHGSAIGATIQGLPSGIYIDEEYIKDKMEKRRAKPDGLSTKRIETDKVEFISGVYNGYTTGNIITLIIKNENTKSKDYTCIENLLRPGHADYTAYEKYKGYQDKRGGGHFSGRLTAPVVAVGAICSYILEKKGIKIATHIKTCGPIKDQEFSQEIKKLKQQQEILNKKQFAVLNPESEEKIKNLIIETGKNQDSIGGILETAITGVNGGIGEPFFDSVESILSHLIFSIPAIKGIEFGAGFDFANMKGSQANDPFTTDGEKITTITNNNAGINGGITNGMPIIFRTVVKPTPSIYKEQETVNYKTKTNTKIKIEGRHDPCILPRARAVQDAMCAIGILDLICCEYGKVLI